MVPLTSLWLPIVVSAVVAFLASSVIHMMLTYHRSDFAGLPGEDNVMEAMRKAGVQPGDYFFPHCKTQKELGNPETVKRFERGPVGILSVLPSGPPAMGKNLAQWFVFLLVIEVFVAYAAGRTLVEGAMYMPVFRVTGTVAFLAFVGAQPIQSIWRGVKWSTTVKAGFDGLIYALLSAGVFGWLWPR